MADPNRTVLDALARIQAICESARSPTVGDVQAAVARMDGGPTLVSLHRDDGGRWVAEGRRPGRDAGTEVATGGNALCALANLLACYARRAD